jgi:hypothetical protein
VAAADWAAACSSPARTVELEAGRRRAALRWHWVSSSGSKGKFHVALHFYFHVQTKQDLEFGTRLDSKGKFHAHTNNRNELQSNSFPSWI